MSDDIYLAPALLIKTNTHTLDSATRVSLTSRPFTRSLHPCQNKELFF